MPITWAPPVADAGLGQMSSSPLKHFSGIPTELSGTVIVLFAQLCPTLCNPKDCSLPVTSLHGILQARILEWVAISFSRGSSWPRNWTRVSYIAGRFFTVWATGKSLALSNHPLQYLPKQASHIGVPRHSNRCSAPEGGVVTKVWVKLNGGKSPSFVDCRTFQGLWWAKGTVTLPETAQHHPSISDSRPTWKKSCRRFVARWHVLVQAPLFQSRDRGPEKKRACLGSPQGLWQGHSSSACSIIKRAVSKPPSTLLWSSSEIAPPPGKECCQKRNARCWVDLKDSQFTKNDFKSLKKAIESTSTNGQANSYWTNTTAVKTKNLENMQTNEQNKMNVQTNEQKWITWRL